MKLFNGLLSTIVLTMVFVLSMHATPTEYIQLVTAQTTVVITNSTHGIGSDFLLVKPVLITGKPLSRGQFKWEMNTNHSHDVTITFPYSFTGAVYLSGPFETDTYDADDLAVLFADGDPYDEYNYPPYISMFSNATWDSPVVRSFSDSSKYFRIVAPKPVNAIVWGAYNVNVFVRVYLRNDMVIIGLSTASDYTGASVQCLDTSVCQVEYSIGGASYNITWPSNVIPLGYGNVHNDLWTYYTDLYTTNKTIPRAITRKTVTKYNEQGKRIPAYTSAKLVTFESPEKIKLLETKVKNKENRFTTAGGSGMYTGFTDACITSTTTINGYWLWLYAPSNPNAPSIQYIPIWVPPIVVVTGTASSCIAPSNALYLYNTGNSSWEPIPIYFYNIIQNFDWKNVWFGVWDTGGSYEWGATDKIGAAFSEINWCGGSNDCSQYESDYDS